MRRFAKMDAFYVARQEAVTPHLNGILNSANVLATTSSTA